MQNFKQKSKYTIRYREIALKQKLIYRYEKQLIQNIKDAATIQYGEEIASNIKLLFRQKIGTLTIPTIYEKEIETILNNTFGISWWGKIFEYPRTSNISWDNIADKIGKLLEKNKAYRLTIRRHDKSYPQTSLDIFITLGNILRENGFKIDKHSSNEIVLTVKENSIEITVKQKGLGGLPVGSSGNVMVMLSGGFDSPLASFLLAKRGLGVNLLHFYPESEKNNNKIIKIAQNLQQYIPHLRAFGYPASEIQRHIKDMRLKNKVLLFKYGMAYLTYKFAKHRFFHKDFAIASGDNLAQVASQTLNNINTIDTALYRNGNIDITYLRPLLTYDKKEIIDYIRHLNLFEIINLPYADSCGAMANKSNRKTRTNLELFLKESKALTEALELHLDHIIEYPL